MKNLEEFFDSLGDKSIVDTLDIEDSENGDGKTELAKRSLEILESLRGKDYVEMMKNHADTHYLVMTAIGDSAAFKTLDGGDFDSAISDYKDILTEEEYNEIRKYSEFIASILKDNSPTLFFAVDRKLTDSHLGGIGNLAILALDKHSVIKEIIRKNRFDLLDSFRKAAPEIEEDIEKLKNNNLQDEGVKLRIKEASYLEALLAYKYGISSCAYNDILVVFNKDEEYVKNCLSNHATEVPDLVRLIKEMPNLEEEKEIEITDEMLEKIFKN